MTESPDSLAMLSCQLRFAALLADRNAACQLQSELYSAAFGRASPVGHDARCSLYDLASINDSTLRAHLGANVSAGSIVVVGNST